MIHTDDPGPQEWNGVHVTHKTTVAEIVDIDNVSPDGNLRTGLEMFLRAGEDLDTVIQEARDAGQRVLAIGSGWGLSKINITDGKLVNTKLLNGCYDIGDPYFESGYPAAERANVVVAQCGMQIAELNAFLEITPGETGQKRALKAAGIGNGQTIAGSVSGNTHGSQLDFGAMPDFVVGLHIATGSGHTLWLEKASHPVLNEEFANGIGAELIRDDDLFNAAVVSFGTFGIIAAVAVETAPIYQLDFPAIEDISHEDLGVRLLEFAKGEPVGVYHYEFIFDPHSRKKMAMAASAPKVPWEPGHKTPEPRWIVRDKLGYAPGDNLLRTVAGLLRLLPPRFVTGISFKEYRKRALLNQIRGTPGQLYTSSIYYLEGYTESAFAVAMADAPATINIVSEVARKTRLPSISQVRLVKASEATLGFTRHQPRAAVFEVAQINDETFPEFEHELDAAFKAKGIRYTMHWSKNSGIDAEKLQHMYGAERIASWRDARKKVFRGDPKLMQTFASDVLVETGLA